MKINLYWKNILIMKSKKYNNKWYNQINTKNIIKAQKNGLAESLININVISDDLPFIIKDRLNNSYITDYFKVEKTDN